MKIKDLPLIQVLSEAYKMPISDTITDRALSVTLKQICDYTANILDTVYIKNLRENVESLNVHKTAEGTTVTLQGVRFKNDRAHIDITQDDRLDIEADNGISINSPQNININASKVNVDGELSLHKNLYAKGISKVDIEAGEVHLSGSSQTIIDGGSAQVSISNDGMHISQQKEILVDLNSQRKLSIGDSNIKIRQNADLSMELQEGKTRLNIVANEIRWVEKVRQPDGTFVDKEHFLSKEIGKDYALHVELYEDNDNSCIGTLPTLNAVFTYEGSLVHYRTIDHEERNSYTTYKRYHIFCVCHTESESATTGLFYILYDESLNHVATYDAYNNNPPEWVLAAFGEKPIWIENAITAATIGLDVMMPKGEYVYIPLYLRDGDMILVSGGIDLDEKYEVDGAVPGLCSINQWYEVKTDGRDNETFAVYLKVNFNYDAVDKVMYHIFIKRKEMIV